MQQVPLPHSHIQQTPQHQGQSLPQQQLFVSQDVRNQQDHHNQSDFWSQKYNQIRLYESQQQQSGDQTTQGYRYANENQYKPSNYQPAPGPVTTIRQYSKELTQLDKLYKNEDKFGGTGDNFTFKLSVFYDKCQLVGLSSNAYLGGASVM